MAGDHLWRNSYDVFQGEVLSAMTSASKKVVTLTREINPITFNNLVNVGIKKPARYIGHELGVKKHKWKATDIHWALTYPEV